MTIKNGATAGMNKGNTVCYIHHMLIFTLLHLQTILPRFEFSQTQLCLKGDNLRH